MPPEPVDRDSLPDLTDCERLVDFWHTKDFGKLLDDAANDLLLMLRVRAERDRLRLENEEVKAGLFRAQQSEQTMDGHLRTIQAESNCLRAEIETLKEEQIAFVRALEKAQTENEALTARNESQRTSLEVGRQMYETVCEMNDRLLRVAEAVDAHYSASLDFQPAYVAMARSALTSDEEKAT